MPTAQRAKIYSGTPAAIRRLAKALREGELVGVPTETVYGLAANALDPKACRAIFRAKGRPSHDPLIVHIHHVRQVSKLAEINAAFERLAAAFWPGPLTLVLPKKPIVPEIVTSGRPSVAIRMPAHPLFRRLLRACKLPLAAPSANPFGYISPTTAEHVLEGLGTKIAHILDGGACEIGVESTIVDLRDPDRPVLLRPGAVEKSDLERVLGRRVRLPKRQVAEAKGGALAPGMLSKHYSPRTPLLIHPRLSRLRIEATPANEAIMTLKSPGHGASAGANVFPLSRRGDLAEVAHNLFSTLRALDRGQWKRIHVCRAPGRSALALAINDRLSRAAAKR